MTLVLLPVVDVKKNENAARLLTFSRHCQGDTTIPLWCMAKNKMENPVIEQLQVSHDSIYAGSSSRSSGQIASLEEYAGEHAIVW
jgi:hypothetical protein